MRALAAAAALAGCSAEPLITVEISAESVNAWVVDTDCECRRPQSGCHSWTDTGPSESGCSCEYLCRDALFSLSLNGQNVGSVIGGGGWLGDYRGGSIYIQGCGGEATIDLPSELPSPPTGLYRDEAGLIFFTPPPGNEWSTVRSVNAVYEGTVCTVKGPVTLVNEPKIKNPFLVKAEQRVEHPPATIGDVELTVSSTASSFPSNP
jgi:hypothetical protein